MSMPWYEDSQPLGEEVLSRTVAVGAALILAENMRG